MSTPDQNPEPSYATAKAFMLTSAFWFAVATTFGLIGAGYLIAPDFLANIEYIHFGRIRPMHINGKIACRECHGQVENSQRLPAKKWLMGECVACHQKKNVNLDCWLACHS